MKTTIVLACAVTLTCSFDAQAQEARQFRDWYAACDNLRNCSAYGFGTQDASPSAYLRIERGASPDAVAALTITVDMSSGSTFGLQFDDRTLPGLPSGNLRGEEGDGHDMRRVRIQLTPALVASMRKAKAIVVTRTDPPARKLDAGDRRSTISMSGATAALLWIDDRQQRLDTPTAFVRSGGKAPDAMLPLPAAPVIVAAKPQSGTAPKPDPAILAQVRKVCEGDDRAALEDSAALSPTLFLYSYACPDMSGAYNMNGVFMIVAAGNPKAARAVDFVWPFKMADQPQDHPRTLATNASFDPKSMELQTFNKGRGIGDCGTAETWVFDGRAFRLAELSMMSECMGVPPDDWPVLYRAEVRR